MPDKKGKNDTKSEKARVKETTQILKDAGIPKKVIDSVIKQATKTGQGLSVNEAKFIQNKAMFDKTGLQAKPFNAKSFLGNLQGRLDYNSAIQRSIDLQNNKGSDTSSASSEPIFTETPPPPQMVRVPERDVVNLAQETVSAETITNLLFENVGANELTKFLRHDTVEGINPYYDVISNLSDIKRKFDPSNLISLQKTNASLFDIYPIKLQDKIPNDTYLQENNLLDYIYIDTNGDLVVEVVNMKDSEIVEIEIDTSGTIYEIGES